MNVEKLKVVDFNKYIEITKEIKGLNLVIQAMRKDNVDIFAENTKRTASNTKKTISIIEKRFCNELYDQVANSGTRKI